MAYLYRSPIPLGDTSPAQSKLRWQGQCIVGCLLTCQERGNTRDHIGESCPRVESRFGGGMIGKSSLNANCQRRELAQTETD